MVALFHREATVSVSNQETQFPYTGNGVTVTFPYNCQVQKAGDLDVYVAGVLVTSGFTINGVGSLSGGSVTFAVAPAAGVSVVIERVVELERTTDYQQNGDFLARVVNPDFDRIWMALQQFGTNLSRVLRFPRSDVNPSTELPAAAQRANKVLGFDSSGNPVVIIPVSGSADEVAIDLANFEATLNMQTYAAIRAYSGFAAYLEVYTPGINGRFVRTVDTTSADDGGTILVSLDGTRWKRQFTGPIEVDWFGAFGLADSSAAIGAAISAAQNTAGGAFIAFRSGATYKILSGITYNSCLVGMIGRGTTIDCTGMTSGYAFNPKQTGFPEALRVGQALMHPLDGFRFLGPGFGVSAVGCFAINAAGDSVAVNAGNIIRNCMFNSFATDIRFGIGSFFTRVENCNFQGINGSGVDTVPGIFIEDAVNSGERNTFSNCVFGARYLGFTQANPNADTYFIDCSFDYFAINIMSIFGGLVSIIGGHTEIAQDVDFWYKISGDDSLLVIGGGHKLAIGEDKSQYAPFYSDSTCTRGGIVIKDMIILAGNRTVSTYLIGGTGRAKVDSLTHGLSTTAMLTSMYENELAYPSFESADFTSDWSLGGTVLPNRSTQITPHSGAYSLRFNPVVGNALAPGARTIVPCKPGDLAAIEFWYSTVNLAGTGSTFLVNLSYVDKTGNAIGVVQAALVQTGNIGAWTRVRAGLPSAAPAGTHGYSAGFSLSVPTSGAPLAYIDDVVITVG